MGEMHRQKNPQKNFGKRAEVLSIFSLHFSESERVGSKSALDQGVGVLTAPPTNRTEEAAAL